MNPDERVKLTLMGISYSPLKSGAFAMLLAQVDGPYRIPVVIGASEAQSIAIKLENISTPRPMTHDLFCSFAHAFGVTLVEVNIYKFEDGIFSSELVFTDGTREVTIDSRTSDAVAIAIRTGAPIYTTKEILSIAGTILDEKEGEQTDEPKPEKPNDPEDMTIDQLRALLNKYIEEENYEDAGRISEIIRRKEAEE